jgi:hypothetical protein
MTYITNITNVVITDVGTFYEGNTLHGTVSLTLHNASGTSVIAREHLNVKIFNNLGYVVKYDSMYVETITLNPGQWAYNVIINWSVELGTEGTGFYIKIESSDNSIYFANSTTFNIVRILSSEKKILLYGFRVSDNPGLIPTDIWAPVIDHTNRSLNVYVPSGTVVTALKPYYYPSYAATSVPLTGVADDFTFPVSYTITAEDGSNNDYEVTVVITETVGVPNLFIYDNDITRVSPLELERGRVVKFYVLISNSGSLTSLADTLHIRFHDSEDLYVDDLPDIEILPIDFNEDRLVSGEYTIPDDVPLGSSIDYMLTFQLVSSIVSRHFLVSKWNTESQTIVYNKNSKAFIRESIVRSKMYARINKNLYSLKENTYGDFYLHTDLILDGEILMYGREFEPSITFVINKFAFEKVFDNIVAQVGSIGVKQVEYWTDKQYSKHIWPIDPLSQVQTRPWIDPEYREDRWYFPVHNELLFHTYNTEGSQDDQSTVVISEAIPITIPATGKISINDVEYVYTSFTGSTFTLFEATGIIIPPDSIVTVIDDDSVPTREMRGMYLKVKITFKAKYKFTLKNILTEFRPSNI